MIGNIDLCDPAYRIFLTVAAVLTGAAFGSFINVCIWRMPRGESVVSVPSHCTVCGKNIRFYDNIPIASYLILRGRCRHCRTPYSSCYFWVEIFCAATVGAMTYLTLTGILAAERWIPGFIIIMLSTGCGMTDLQHRIIPDRMTLPALSAGILYHAFIPGGKWNPAGLITVSATVCFAALALVLFRLLCRRIFKKEAFGMGDIKLAAAPAALVPWQTLFFILMAASLTAFAAGIIYALAKHRDPAKITLPFGTFIAAAAISAVFMPF